MNLRTPINWKSVLKLNMKKIHVGIVVSLFAGAMAARANLVINGNFAAGDTGFTSDYADGTGTQNSLLTFGSNQGAGYYAVGTDPSYYNPYWTYGPTSVPGDSAAQMLIVNGSPTVGKTVWQGTLSSPLIAGESYTMSALVASIYTVSEPTLTFNIGGTTIGSITLSGTGTWETFTASFVAGSGLPAFIDLDTDLNGNDFVVSEISITPVPETTTMIAGALLLLPFGASMLRILRRNRMA
ncbi:MAG: hypothetical protein ABSE16_18135 [Verrucomicrobiota bacterium]